MDKFIVTYLSFDQISRQTQLISIVTDTKANPDYQIWSVSSITIKLNEFSSESR